MRSIVSIATAVLVVIGVFVAWSHFDRAEPGFVTVVRNGGPFDNRNVRQILTPADGMQWTGWGSTLAQYPTTERYDNVEPGEFGKDVAEGDTLDVDRYRTRTKDGVDIGVKGQFKYVINTDAKVLEQFDTAYGQRTYAVPGTADRVKVSDGDNGMAVFIAGQVRPVEEEAMRQAIGDVTCSSLEASCALLQTTTLTPDQAAAAAAALANAPSNSQTFADLSKRISDLMVDRINTQLGGPYLTSIRFTLRSIDLPPNVRDAINRVQVVAAQVAEANANAAKTVAEAQGRLDTAKKDADAQVERQRGYQTCGVCADIDRTRAQGEALKNLPSGIQVYAPGNGNTQLPIR